MALSSAVEQYRRQQRLTALAVRDARRVRGSDAQIESVVNRYQLAAAQLGADSVPEMLAEQGIPDLPAAGVNPSAFLSDRVAEMAGTAATNHAVDRLVATLVQDSGRAAAGVATAVRPNIHGHVRYLNPPSCSRCAILAGRIYRWSQGFQRHPLCDCVMVPTTMESAPDLISDPMTAFERGQIRGLSKKDAQAILDGADMGQVVNIRRKAAGLSSSGMALTRAGRLTPDGIYTLAKSRDEAVELLRANGYLLNAPAPVASRPLTLVPKPPEPEPPKFGKVLDVDPGRRATPLKGANGAPLSRDVWNDAPFSMADGDFRYIADPDDRATGVLQYWTDAGEAAKQAALNLKAGRDALTGVDLTGSHLFLDRGYELADLEADITATAHKLIEWEAAEESLGTVYKGVQFTDAMSWDEVRAALREDAWHLSSVTPQAEHAHMYAGRPDRTRSVVFEIEDARGVRLDSVGNHAVEREFLVSGRIEILGSEFRRDAAGYGDRLYVKARQVSE